MLKSGIAVSGAVLPRMILGNAATSSFEGNINTDLKQLTSNALDAAVEGGVDYAEVWLTHQFYRRLKGSIFDSERMVVGIRALYKGYWGFASSSIWSVDEMRRLGKEAALLALQNAKGPQKSISLTPRPVLNDIRWVTPVEVDPFKVNPVEVLDHIAGLQAYTIRKYNVICNWDTVQAEFYKTFKVYASSDGSYSEQTLYMTGGRFGFEKEVDKKKMGRGLDEITESGVGLEMWLNEGLKDSIPLKVEEINYDLKLPVEPVDIGRFNAVLDSAATVGLLSNTIGKATELDRILGYEANSDGTSYITDPEEMLDDLIIGSKLLNIHCNRDEKGGAATVYNDDEGVLPSEFQLISNGVLSSYHTSRDLSQWFPNSSQAFKDRIQTNGSAYAESAESLPSPYPANISIQPASNNESYQSMLENMEDGMAFESGGMLSPDVQLLSALWLPNRVYKVKNGTKVELFPPLHAGVLFNTLELWKSLVAIGGNDSQRCFGSGVKKGTPERAGWHSVTTVPMSFKDLSVIDSRRKA